MTNGQGNGEATARPRTIVFYHYFEANSLYAFNLQTFLHLALTAACDFVFILASDCSIEISPSSNIRVLRTENTGSDFNGFSEAVRVIDKCAYEYFIFVNCSVCGPFLSFSTYRPWHETIVGMLDGDVKLVGSTINILPAHSGFARECEAYYGKAPPFPHVQSMFFAIDRECLAHLVENEFFTVRIESRHDLIARSEVGMSQLVLARGWNIDCLIPEMRGIDYRSASEDINSTSTEGDPWFPGGCFGRTLHPLEVMFFKANRGLMTLSELESLVGAQIAQRRFNRAAKGGSASIGSSLIAT